MALTDNTVTDLAGGWYRVGSNITFDHTINLYGETHLVIDSGKTMTVNVSSGDGIQSAYPFTVSGEGTLSVSALDNFGILVSSYSQTGATVSVSAKYSGIRCYAEGVANNCVISGGRLTTSDKVLNGLVDADNDIIILGGQIDQTGTGIGLYSTYGSIILGCSSAGDYIRVNSYRWSVRIADWQTLTDGTDDYTGVITDTSKLIGKQLRLKDQYTITVAENIAHGSVAIASVNGAESATTAHYLDTVALAVTPGANSELDSVYYRQTQGGDEAIRTITPVDGVYSFTMPACDVTVGAVFRYVPPTPPAPVYTMSLAAYSFPFTGEAIEPAVTVRRYGTALPEDAYTVSYRDNVGVGTATVTVTDASVFSLSTSFQITENAVENPEITYDPASGAVGVRDGERTIPADTYEVKREDQDGRVSVTVTAREGSGYRFTATRTFEKRAIPTGTLLAALKHKGKTRLDLTWTAAEGADGCDVFFGPYPGEPAITEANQATGLSLTGLVAGQEYRAVVKAYVMADGEKVYFAESPAAHAFASGSGKKRTNPKAVRLDKASRKFALQVGKGKTLKASVTRVSGSKKLLTRNGRLRYVSDDPGVATVNAKGRVTAVAAGTCTIYVLTANGLRAEAKVTVK